MSYLPVIDTYIAEVKAITNEAGRCYHLITIDNPGFTGLPGQFVMIQKQDKGFAWSYPYMIYEDTTQHLKIIATQNSSLFQSSPGEKIALWGANGKGYTLNGSETIIAEPAMMHLALPLIRSADSLNVIIYGCPTECFPELLPAGSLFTSDLSEISRLLHASSAPVFMALNITNLEKIAEPSDKTLTKRITCFVSTQIGCGIGACKACYLHSPEIHMGIPVCCNGPYLPYDLIDFSQDRKCFQIFR